MQGGPDNRSLARLQPVQLIVCAPCYRATGRAHRLLPHLALIHVARTLIKVRERRQIRNHTQHVCRCVFDVGRDAPLNLVRLARNVQVHLLKRTHMVLAAVEQVAHRAHHPGAATEQIQTRVLPAMRRGHEADLEIQRHRVQSLRLPHTQHSGHVPRECRCRVAQHNAVQLHAHMCLRTDLRRDTLCHTERRQQRWDVGHVQVARRELARVGKVVQQATRTAIRCVDWTKKAPGLWKQLADGGRLELGKERATVHTAEMRHVPVKVELLRHDRKATNLLQIQAGRRRQVPGR